jgi:hypothetical protein
VWVKVIVEKVYHFSLNPQSQIAKYSSLKCIFCIKPSLSELYEFLFLSTSPLKRRPFRKCKINPSLRSLLCPDEPKGF